MPRIQGRNCYDNVSFGRDTDFSKQEYDGNRKQSSIAQETQLPKSSSELKTLAEKTQTLENINFTEKSKCSNATSFSMMLQEGCEQSGKKKTPMCQVNELARHHKIHPQYRLTEESGPPHQKTFVVNLKLGDEQYASSGQSIKKAQHAAAEVALQNTSFLLPEPKSKVKHPISFLSDKPVTPTVELNAFAMKLNLPPVYTNLAPLSIKPPMREENNPSSICKSDHLLNEIDQKEKFLNTNFRRPIAYTPQRFSSTSNQRYYFNRHQPIPLRHRVTLAVGPVFVTGEGPSPQAARHHAAQQALDQLRSQIPAEKAQLSESALIGEADTDSDLKSPVSLTHELALKLNQAVEFAVLNESGPPHMRNFVVQCKLGEVTTQGEGNCKKMAKRKAAEQMIEELKKVHPNWILRPSEGNSPRNRAKSKSGLARRKPRNLVKDVTSASNGSLGTKPQDPISQLVQLQQARREKEPVFTVLSERGIPRQSPEFVVEVAVGSIMAIGVGAKKKEAKRAAALKALDALGDTRKLSKLEGNSAEEELCPLSNGSISTANCPGRQMVPGLLLLGDSHGKKMDSFRNANSSAPTGIQESSPPLNPHKSSGKMSPEIRLRYLAGVLRYEVEFSDFPKGKKGDFVSLVTLSTNPPQVSHGLGATLEEAHDNAAYNMLKLIAEGVLDGMADPEKENED